MNRPRLPTLAAALAFFAAAPARSDQQDATASTAPPAAAPAGSPGAAARPGDAAGKGSGRAAPTRKAIPPAAVLEEVEGTVKAIDRNAHRLEVATQHGDVSLTFDRNTMVYTARGMGTVLDVVPGAELRAGRNASFVVYWIQVRAPGNAPPAPAPGTGPSGGGGPPPSESGGAPAGTGSGPTSSPPGGSPPPGGGQ